MDSRLIQYNDNLFPNLTIKQFSSRQLQVPEERVTDALFQALPTDKQTPANKVLLEKAMPLKVIRDLIFYVKLPLHFCL